MKVSEASAEREECVEKISLAANSRCMKFESTIKLSVATCRKENLPHLRSFISDDMGGRSAEPSGISERFECEFNRPSKNGANSGGLCPCLLEFSMYACRS